MTYILADATRSLLPPHRWRSSGTSRVGVRAGVGAAAVTRSHSRRIHSGAVPPEFAADLFIRAAGFDGRCKGTWRLAGRSLLSRRFNWHDPHWFPCPDIPSPPRDSTPSHFRFGRSTGLLELRRDRALGLAGTIEVRIPALTCRDAMVTNAAGAFDVARHSYRSARATGAVGPLRRRSSRRRSRRSSLPTCRRPSRERFSPR